MTVSSGTGARTTPAGRLTSGPLPAGIVALVATVLVIEYGPSLFGLGGLTEAASSNDILLVLAGPAMAAALLALAALSALMAVTVQDRAYTELSAQSKAGLLVTGVLLLLAPVMIFVATRNHPFSLDGSLLAALALVVVAAGWAAGLAAARRPALAAAVVGAAFAVTLTAVVWAVMAWALIPRGGPSYLLPTDDLMHGYQALARWHPIARAVCTAAGVAVPAAIMRRDAGRFTAPLAVAAAPLVAWLAGTAAVLPDAPRAVASTVTVSSVGWLLLGCLAGYAVAVVLHRRPPASVTGGYW